MSGCPISFEFGVKSGKYFILLARSASELCINKTDRKPNLIIHDEYEHKYLSCSLQLAFFYLEIFLHCDKHDSTFSLYIIVKG